jgi:hypothetical protein
MSVALASPPTLPVYFKQQTQSQTPTASEVCACTKSATLTEERGATLSTKLTLTVTDKTTGVKSPVDITGCHFQFTAKVDPSYTDDDPSTVKIDWSETNTPTQGITWLVVPAATTQAMQTIAYAMQVRMVSASGVVTPVVKGTLTITEPVSARF